ncbi:bifunctional copper resistance protein CopD/cytochrome c oxidase assembly protein [Pseudonocardia sp. MH-G8]|uniref:bifunctional copper resistance protein CopD/cytochrome c oxidase assembly protein n=1 Tax=Pseudonocardia sp. MH-G8 TaxID=1854588 RepID=UPI000B9FB3D2|nr:bifunctional copper resistance protein CopD/cytochrome c oxidase assembly protein [Pseudonocardia sp. MH-G8]OZM76551.1 copper resistance protein CopD [Pseudonocardia sp. MH-G8]
MTTWVLPAARVLRDVAAVVTVGLLLAAAALGPIPGPSAQATRTMGSHAYRWVLAAGWSALVWFTVTVLDVGYTASDVLGRPLGEVVGDLHVLGSALDLSPIPGLVVVAGLVAVLVVACRVVLSRSGVVMLLALALAATLPPAFGGHSGAGSGDHRMAVSAMLVHVVGVVLWAGGLLALTLAHRLPTPDLARAVHRYSRLAGWCLVAVGLSGVVNVLARIDPLSGLWQSWYGWLVLAKLGAFGVLAAVGGLHRRRTLPPLRRGRRSAFVQLAIVELVIFAATVGLAVGLSRTPTPGGASGASAHAAEIDSLVMPEAPGVRSLLLDGRPEPVFLAVAGVAIALYLIGVRRLRRGGRVWPPAATASWVAGWLLAAWATSGGLARYAEVLFSANLVQHLALALPVPLLLVAGRPVTLAQRTLTPADDPRWPGPREWLSDLLGSRPLHVLVRPPVALAVQAVLAGVVYFAGLYETALRSETGTMFAYGLVLMLGYAFWWGVMGIDAAPHRPTPLTQAVTLGASVALLNLLGLALMHAQTDIGGYRDTGLSRPWGPRVLGDQVLAGEITLWVAGSVSVLIVVAALLTTRRARRAGPAHGHSQPRPVADAHAS